MRKTFDGDPVSRPHFADTFTHLGYDPTGFVTQGEGM